MVKKVQRMSMSPFVNAGLIGVLTLALNLSPTDTIGTEQNPRIIKTTHTKTKWYGIAK